MTTPAARVSRTIDFRRVYLQPMMRPVQVDSASASAVAAKKIFMGSELGGRGACASFVVLGFGTSSFAASDLAALGRITFREGR